MCVQCIVGIRIEETNLEISRGWIYRMRSAKLCVKYFMCLKNTYLIGYVLMFEYECSKVPHKQIKYFMYQDNLLSISTSITLMNSIYSHFTVITLRPFSIIMESIRRYFYPFLPISTHFMS